MNRKNLIGAVLAGLLTVLALFASNAMAIDECMEGNWYDPTVNDDRGLVLSVLDDGRAVAHYYTWTTGQDMNPYRDHYIFLGENDIGGAWAFKAYQSLYGGTRYVGTGSLTTIDANTVRFEYNFVYDFLRLNNPSTTIPWCLACWEDVEYKRLTSDTACNLE